MAGNYYITAWEVKDRLDVMKSVTYCRHHLAIMQIESDTLLDKLHHHGFMESTRSSGWFGIEGLVVTQ